MHHGRHQRSGRVDCSGPRRHVLQGGHALYRRIGTAEAGRLFFRAAEILYRHAAGRGNAIGWLRLGYVYAYDRCEGGYFRSYYNNFGEVPPKPDTDVLAYECFRHAAEAGIAEGCYKLGDMLAEGRGCAADHAKALDMFLRAYMCDGYCGRHILHEIHD